MRPRRRRPVSDDVRITLARIRNRPADTTAFGKPCRWPHCTGVAAGWRWSSDHGYVPLCVQHLLGDTAYPTDTA